MAKIDITKKNTKRIVKECLKDINENGNVKWSVLGDGTFAKIEQMPELCYDICYPSLYIREDLLYLFNKYNGDINLITKDFYDLSLLPFVKRNMTGKTFLFHGSNNEFNPADIRLSTRDDYYQKSLNGYADGYGIYLTKDIKKAARYGRYLYIYYLEKDFKENYKKLSSKRQILTYEQLENLIETIYNYDNDFLYNYGDLDFEGYDVVLANAIELIRDNENDVDIICDLINSGAEEEIVMNWLINNGYVYSQSSEFEKDYIFYDNKILKPYKVIEQNSLD